MSVCTRAYRVVRTRRSLVLLWGSLASTFVIAAAAQAGWTPSSDGRMIYAQFSDPGYSQTLDEFPPVPFAAWGDSVYAGGAYYASIGSEAIIESRIAGGGQVHGSSESGSSRSTYGLTFSVAIPTPYAITGNLYRDLGTFSNVTFSLKRGATIIYAATADDDGTGSKLLRSSGILSPGVYTLKAEGTWYDNQEGPTDAATYSFVLRDTRLDVPVLPGGGAVALIALFAGCGAWLARREATRS